MVGLNKQRPRHAHYNDGMSVARHGCQSGGSELDLFFTFLITQN